MCVLSNNPPKEIGIYEATESVPDYILKILSVLEKELREFNVTVKNRNISTRITIQDKKSTSQGESMRIILLDVFNKPKSYLMNLYHQTSNGSKNQKKIYEIKVNGNYELKTLKNNLIKLIEGKNLLNRPRFYPF